MAKDNRSIAQRLKDRGKDLRAAEDKQVRGNAKKAPTPPKKKPSR